eukprot:2372742-Pyramimonas_sp.AAC.2
MDDVTANSGPGRTSLHATVLGSPADTITGYCMCAGYYMHVSRGCTWRCAASRPARTLAPTCV